MNTDTCFCDVHTVNCTATCNIIVLLLYYSSESTLRRRKWCIGFVWTKYPRGSRTSQHLHTPFTHHCIHYTASFFFCESISRIQWPITERRTTTVWFYQQTCFFQLWNLKLDPVLPICSRLRPLYLPIVRHKVLGALLITQKFPMTLKGIKPREKAMYSGQLEMARLLVFPQYTFIT